MYYMQLFNLTTKAMILFHTKANSTAIFLLLFFIKLSLL